MTQLLLEFTRADKIKNDLKIKRSTLKGILMDNSEYVDALEKKRAIADKISHTKHQVSESYPDLMSEIDKLSQELKLEKEKISDLAINKLVAGETLRIPDGDGGVMVPVIKVTFKRETEEQ
jgi:predicted RNase H-like nuclease (RuvC/YqgF family)